MYNSADYSKGRDKCYTNITIEQLSKLTGVSQEYISKSFLRRFKRSHFGKCTTKQVLFKEKRNQYELPYPNENYRIIWKHLFSDDTLTPEEKGLMIGLYCLCYNNTFRIDFTDAVIAEKLGLSPKTYRKYRNSLIEKKVIWTSYFAPLALISFDHMDAKIIIYPHLGYTTWIDTVLQYEPTEEEIETYRIYTHMKPNAYSA